MQVDSRTERELVEAAKDGSLESFGELCGRYYSALAAIAYAILRDHQLAEDAAQEALARAIRNIRRLEESARFGVWIAAICRNAAKDMRDSRRRIISLEEEEVVPDRTQEPADCSDVRRAIWELNEKDREAIVLRYYNELSQEKMGEVLGISRSAANRRLRKAQARLERRLRRYGFSEAEI